MKKVLVAMSGGVDSTVAAYLLKKAGYDCTGATMILYQPEEGDPHYGEDRGQEAAHEAELACRRMGIPFRKLDFSDRFDQTVIQPFIQAYRQGLTPNPCVVCNRYLKFGAFLQAAREGGFDYMATGHYAQVIRDGQGRFLLKEGDDPAKDQTYFLYSLGQDVLSQLLLPLGGLKKEEVRRIAHEQGFSNAGRKDSQDICFVAGGDYARFIADYEGVEEEEGEIVDREGHLLGHHQGALAYTIGQRRGLGLAAPQPLYVLDKDMASNRVIVGSQDQLFAREVSLTDFHWISQPFSGAQRMEAKARYRSPQKPGVLYMEEGGRIRFVFDQPERALTPGQSLVCYQGSICLGGGVIQAVKRREEE